MSNPSWREQVAAPSSNRTAGAGGALEARVRGAGLGLTVGLAILSISASAQEPVLNLNGTWRTERGMRVCLVHEGHTVVGHDEPGSNCPNGKPRGGPYITDGEIEASPDGALFSGNMYRCTNPTLVTECGQEPSWGPSVFSSSSVRLNRISGTRRGEYWEDCVKKKDTRVDFSLIRVRKCDLDGVCDTIAAMKTSIDPGRSILAATARAELRDGLNALRTQLECLSCEGRRSRTQELLDSLLGSLNRLRDDGFLPGRPPGGDCWDGMTPDECNQAHRLAEIDAVLAELGGSLGCDPVAPAEGPAVSRCVYNCLNSKVASYLVKKQLKKIDAVKKLFTGLDCAKCADSGDEEACWKCVNKIGPQIPGISETIDIAQCIEQCSHCPQDCPFEYVCEEPVHYCSSEPLLGLAVRCTIDCDSDRNQWVFPHQCRYCAVGDECRMQSNGRAACYTP